jgi:hypothetical protein
MSQNPFPLSAPTTRRRRRALASLVVTALAAPLGVVSLAATATPVGAAPADAVPLVVSGDTLNRNTVAPTGSNWTWQSPDFNELRSVIAGVNIGGVTFTTAPAISSPTYDRGGPELGDETGSLANIDVYFSGAVGGGGAGSGATGYTEDEEVALLDWVRDGGVLIANTNSRVYDVTRFLGDNPDGGVDDVQVHQPRAFFDDATNGCTHQVAPDCEGGREESAPRASVVEPGTELSDEVTSIRNWHTITYFEEGTLPENHVVVARLSYTCDEAQAYCKDQTDPVDYNNNIGTGNFGTGQPVVAYVPFGSGQFGSGAVVMTSDVDTFSNHYDIGDGDPGGEMAPGNRQLAINVFQWIAANRSGLVAGPAADPPGFTPITPTRVYDTRVGTGTTVGKVPGGQSRDVQVTGTFGGVTIPSDATAVAINLTATNQSGAGFLTVTPGGGAKSNTSNLNIPPGLIDVANAAVVGLSGGKIRVHNENNPTDVIVDVVGYWAPGGTSYLTATDPTRVLDSRSSTKVGPGQTRKVQITGTYPNGVTIPGGTTGVVMNVTATNGTAGGFLTIHDTPTVPNASNVNFRANVNVPNLVFAKLAGDGSVYVTNALGNTDVIFDVNGYFGASGSEMTTVGPGRIFDTRVPIGQLAAGKVPTNGTATLGINGAGGFLPTDGVGSVLVNVTVDQPTAAGFLTAYPGPTLPDASNVNFAPGQTVANLALAKVTAGGELRVANTSPGASHVIVDVFAWFG